MPKPNLVIALLMALLLPIACHKQIKGRGLPSDCCAKAILSNMNERSLFHKHENIKQAYRITIMREMGFPISVSLIDSGSSKFIRYKMIIGEGCCSLGGIVEDKKVPVSNEQWVKFSNAFETLDLFSKPSTIDPDVLDDTFEVWTVEILKDNRYHYIVRANPTTETVTVIRTYNGVKEVKEIPSMALAREPFLKELVRCCNNLLSVVGHQIL